MQVTVPVTVESVESMKVKVPLLMGLETEGSLELKVPVNETVETSPLAAGYMARGRKGVELKDEEVEVSEGKR